MYVNINELQNAATFFRTRPHWNWKPKAKELIEIYFDQRKTGESFKSVIELNRQVNVPPQLVITIVVHLKKQLKLMLSWPI